MNIRYQKKTLGEIFTPFSFCEEMLNKLPEEVWSNPDLKWIDPACGTGNFLFFIKQKLMKGLREAFKNKINREEHILKNMLYGMDIQEKNILITLLRLDPNNNYNLENNILLADTLNYNFENKLYDIVVTNPPYNISANQLHLKFLLLSFDISSRYILLVEPIAWLLGEKKENYKKIFNKIQNTLKDLTILNINPIFNIQLFTPGGILLFDKNHNGTIKVTNKLSSNRIDIYENIQNLNIHGNIKEYFSLKNKILDYCKMNSSLFDHAFSDGKYYVNVGKIRAHIYTDRIDLLRKPDFYTFLPNDRKVETIKKQQYFGFSEYHCAENFLFYIRTKFARFCLSIFKIDSHLECGQLKSVPWLDFSKKWDSNSLYEYFNISREEVKFIEEFIPDY